MADHPQVSVFMAAANASHSLPRSLESIRAQDYPGVVEVLVAAADEPTASIARDQGVTVIPNPSGLTPSGLNLAAGASSGEFLIRVDAQSALPLGYISRAVETLIATGADNVGGMQEPVGTTFWERAIAGAMASLAGAGGARYRIGGKAGPAETVYLGAFRRSTFEKLGGFDESFSRNQDYELNQRIRNQGGTVWFDPTLRVEYRPRPSLTALARQYFQYGRWKRRFAAKHPGTLRPRQVIPPVLMVSLTTATALSIVWPVLLVAPALYLGALVAAGLGTISTAGFSSLGVPVALAVMHWTWGVGFLLGQRRPT